ncbi:branched-chain amino acid ABC transporter permease [Streptomyces sp. NY05-11A]|uniref:branched-chain amino acid ABC transporter permease n=1 Tax=Streptomyces soliscabiei TaxID=588897 RepID=UPI0029B1D15B|nr:ABC transporter permease [Streptomyces sp. NY05-11A]MDX2676711.1 ABC transporter permease [Streptomyces sp. NY05-11A]
MTTFLTFTAYGLVVGAIYAIAASGLVLTYNTSGIFNFAHGAQAMIGAFTYYQLNVVWALPTWLALALVLGVLGPGTGLLLHALIMRRLHGTEPVTRIVVTVAVLLGLVALSQWVWDPGESRIPPMLFGADRTVTVLDVTLRYHQLLCLAVALVLAVVLRVLFTRTRAGVLMRATVDDPDLLRLAGHDPNRVSALAWALGSSLAVLAGVFITPVIGGTLEANALTLLVVDAFAAALFGRLRSIPLTFAGALVLGLAGTYLVGYAPAGWTWAANLQQSLPMVVLFVVLLFLPYDRLRGAATRSRERYEVPTVRRAAIWSVILVVGMYLYARLLDDPGVGLLLAGLAFAVLALSITLLTGYAGELNLAPLAFSAVATLVAYHVGARGDGGDARMSLWGVVAGVAAAALSGAVVALPAVRLRGLYLALATLAFGVFVSTMLLRDTTAHTWFGHTFTIFPSGNLLIPPLKAGPVDLADQDTFLLVVSGIFALLGVGLVALRNSGYGRRLAAMKDSPAAAAMLGQRLIPLKLSVFALSTAIAGLGGILMSMALTSVAIESFGFTMSLSVVMLTVVAGIGYVSGALVGGLIVGGGMSALTLLLSDLGVSHPHYADTFGIVTHLMLVGTALAGIGVAHNPSGFLHDLFAGHRRLARTPRIRYAAVALQVLLYALAWTEMIGAAAFLFAGLALWFALPGIGAAVCRGAGKGTTPPELLGIDDDWLAGLTDRLDRELGMTLPPAPRTPEPVVVRPAWPRAKEADDVPA